MAKPYKRLKKNQRAFGYKFTNDSVQTSWQSGPPCVNGKHSYATKEQAKEAVKRLKQDGGSGPFPRPFKCPICSWWHNGHVPTWKGSVSREFLRAKFAKKHSAPEEHKDLGG